MPHIKTQAITLEFLYNRRKVEPTMFEKKSSKSVKELSETCDKIQQLVISNQIIQALKILPVFHDEVTYYYLLHFKVHILWSRAYLKKYKFLKAIRQIIPIVTILPVTFLNKIYNLFIYKNKIL